MSPVDPPTSFGTTRWSLVLSAGQANATEGRQALETLCATYWYPLYAFVRRRGYQEAEAHDLTQAFFAELLEHQRLLAADQQRGRFRSFLLASISNFIQHQWRHQHAIRRGSQVPHVPLDFAEGESRYRFEPADALTPQKIYDRRWTLTLLATVMERLEEEYRASGKAAILEALKPHLGGDPEKLSYREIAAALQISESAVKTAAHRLRRR